MASLCHLQCPNPVLVPSGGLTVGHAGLRPAPAWPAEQTSQSLPSSVLPSRGPKDLGKEQDTSPHPTTPCSRAAPRTPSQTSHRLPPPPSPPGPASLPSPRIQPCPGAALPAFPVHPAFPARLSACPVPLPGAAAPCPPRSLGLQHPPARRAAFLLTRKNPSRPICATVPVLLGLFFFFPSCCCCCCCCCLVTVLCVFGVFVCLFVCWLFFTFSSSIHLGREAGGGRCAGPRGGAARIRAFPLPPSFLLHRSQSPPPAPCGHPGGSGRARGGRLPSGSRGLCRGIAAGRWQRARCRSRLLLPPK